MTLPVACAEMGTATIMLQWNPLGKLKMEWLNDYKFKTREEAKKAVFEYIELFYNRRRTQSTNDFTPLFKM